MTSYPIEKCPHSKPSYLTSNQKIHPVSLEIRAMQIKIVGICSPTLLSLASEISTNIVRLVNVLQS